MLSRHSYRTLIAGLLLAGLLAPLIGAASEVLEQPPCHAQMPATPPTSSQPCDGNILLTCCDGVTMPGAHDPRGDLLPPIALLSSPALLADASSQTSAFQTPSNLAWLASPFQLSVVLRV